MSDRDDDELIAAAYGLVLKVKQFVAGNCSREDVLRFAYEKKLFEDKDQELEALRQILESNQ